MAAGPVRRAFHLVQEERYAVIEGEGYFAAREAVGESALHASVDEVRGDLDGIVCERHRLLECVGEASIHITRRRHVDAADHFRGVPPRAAAADGDGDFAPGLRVLKSRHDLVKPVGSLERSLARRIVFQLVHARVLYLFAQLVPLFRVQRVFVDDPVYPLPDRRLVLRAQLGRHFLRDLPRLLCAADLLHLAHDVLVELRERQFVPRGARGVELARLGGADHVLLVDPVRLRARQRHLQRIAFALRLRLAQLLLEPPDRLVQPLDVVPVEFLGLLLRRLRRLGVFAGQRLLLIPLLPLLLGGLGEFLLSLLRGVGVGYLLLELRLVPFALRLLLELDGGEVRHCRRLVGGHHHALVDELGARQTVANPKTEPCFFRWMTLNARVAFEFI